MTYFLHTKPLEEKITKKKTKDEKIKLIGTEIACTADCSTFVKATPQELDSLENLTDWSQYRKKLQSHTSPGSLQPTQILWTYSIFIFLQNKLYFELHQHSCKDRMSPSCQSTMSFFEIQRLTCFWILCLWINNRRKELLSGLPYGQHVKQDVEWLRLWFHLT